MIQPRLVTKADIFKLRQDFPILNQDVNGFQFVYFDNAATSQTPLQVISAIDEYYLTINSNVHRGVHYLSNKATEAFESAREKVRSFLNAASTKEIIFTRGVTESINLVAYSFGMDKLKAGDEILITCMEHHSNIVPWQFVCERTGARLIVADINDDGSLNIDSFRNSLSERTKLVSFVHISNTLGTVNPVKELTALAHSVGAKVLIDGAQSSPHVAIDVRDIDVDFYTVSAHKMYGPTGIGALYGKEELLNSMQPFHGGGEMISSVSFEKTFYNELPYKFEAGTPNIAGAIGFGAAIDYITRIGYDVIASAENELLEYASKKLSEIGDVDIIGTAHDKASVISFNIQGVHPYDAGTILDQMGIAVRTGFHCTEPLFKRLSLDGSIRASFAFYNSKEEVDRLVQAIEKVKKMLK